jgi:hypothetical protein
MRLRGGAHLGGTVSMMLRQIFAVTAAEHRPAYGG